jgi:hypothetical protein
LQVAEVAARLLVRLVFPVAVVQVDLEREPLCL